MTEPLPKEVLANIEKIGDPLYYPASRHIRMEGATEQAAFDRDYWREYWCALVCLWCGRVPNEKRLVEGEWRATLYEHDDCGHVIDDSQLITRAAFTVAQKEREGR